MHQRSLSPTQALIAALVIVSATIATYTGSVSGDALVAVLGSISAAVLTAEATNSGFRNGFRTADEKKPTVTATDATEVRVQ